jgi:glycosyltransferase involved in cell wall biosynthesis
MRILWLPHLAWDYVRFGQREYYLIEQIRRVHDVQILTWDQVKPSPGSILRSLRRRTEREDGVVIHRARRVPNPRPGHEPRSGQGLWINRYLFSSTVREIVARERIELVVSGVIPRAVGLPPADLPVPLVFDYLDLKMDQHPEVERAYIERSDAVICTTSVLRKRAQRFNPHTYLLPNGADVEGLRQANPDRVRRQFGLEGSKVVSLVGVHASARMFFVDAVAEVAREHPDLVFMVVGQIDELVKAMMQRGRERGLRIVATGRVPRSEVADFFAATDVGLFPGDQTPYFDACCPLKVLEYTAARKPVVATDLAELRNWAFPNVRLARPTTNEFASAIRDALTLPHSFPDMSAYTWPALGERLLSILDEVLDRRRRILQPLTRTGAAR